jgi:hypothetical protein
MSASVICNVDDARGHSKRAQVQEKCAAFYRDKVLAVHKVLLDQGRNLANGQMHLGRYPLLLLGPPQRDETELSRDRFASVLPQVAQARRR